MKEISTKELEQLLKEGKQVNIIDVREVDEVAAGHIPTAVNIPLGLIEFRMHELDKSKEYIYGMPFWRKKRSSYSIPGKPRL